MFQTPLMQLNVDLREPQEKEGHAATLVHQALKGPLDQKLSSTGKKLIISLTINWKVKWMRGEIIII